VGAVFDAFKLKNGAIVHMESMVTEEYMADCIAVSWPGSEDYEFWNEHVKAATPEQEVEGMQLIASLAEEDDDSEEGV
jgi:hypothetical protein